MDANERLHLRKRAQKLRKDIQMREPKRSRQDEEDARPRRPVSLEELMLRLIREEESEDEAPSATGPTIRGQVVGLTSSRCRVQTSEGRLEALLATHILRQAHCAIAVGDFVRVERTQGEPARVLLVEPRRTKLSRRDPGPKIERVVAANVDVVGIVVSVGEPPLHPRLIDRYLMAIQAGGARPILCVNKVDQLTTEALQISELSKLVPYDWMGDDVVLCSAETGLGVETLRTRLRNQLSVFVGHSGVGKSSLVNALAPDLRLEVGAVSTGYGRGTHTTTASTLHELEGGIRLIDTPGIRSFGLWDITQEDLADSFPDFAPFIERCKYRDCRHDREPRCGVKDAVESGELHAYRYETYLRLMEELPAARRL